MQGQPCSVRSVNWGSPQLTECCWGGARRAQSGFSRPALDTAPCSSPWSRDPSAPPAVPPLGWRQNPEEWGDIPRVTAPCVPLQLWGPSSGHQYHLIAKRGGWALNPGHPHVDQFTTRLFCLGAGNARWPDRVGQGTPSHTPVTHRAHACLPAHHMHACTPRTAAHVMETQRCKDDVGNLEAERERLRTSRLHALRRPRASPQGAHHRAAHAWGSP